MKANELIASARRKWPPWLNSAACEMNGRSESVVMKWVGHADSARVRQYFHLHDEKFHRLMQGLDLLGKSVGCSDGTVFKGERRSRPTAESARFAIDTMA